MYNAYSAAQRNFLSGLNKKWVCIMQENGRHDGIIMDC